MRQIDEPIGAMLHFIGQVARSTHPLQHDAKDLLRGLHAEKYLEEPVRTQRVHLLGHPHLQGTLLEDGEHTVTVRWDQGKVKRCRRALVQKISILS